MSIIFTPQNQVKLTNVSVVRLKKSGKRFEIACYKNKVIEWRNNVEQDLDNVLQTVNVFSNVSKGQMANRDDLVKCFGTEDVLEICKEILKKGELQVSEKERSRDLENKLKDVATIIAEKCVNPETKRPYTVSVIEKVMADMHFSAKTGKSSKQQALELIKQMQETASIPIARAQMKIRIVIPGKDAKRIKEKVLELVGSFEEEDFGSEFEGICLIEPGLFKKLNEYLQVETKGKGSVELLTLHEAIQGDSALE